MSWHVPASMPVVAVALIVVVIGCTAGPTAPGPSTPGGGADAPAVTAAATLLARPTPGPSAAPDHGASPSPTRSTTLTADDRRIADAIRTSVAEALPALAGLNAMDPDEQERQFEPIGAWIAAQETAVGAFVPSGCTAPAVELFLDALDQYDDIRARFLAWRDWGAHGHAYPPGAPRVIASTLKEALASLDAGCGP